MINQQKLWRTGIVRLCLGVLCWMLAAGALSAQEAWFPTETLRYEGAESLCKFTALPLLRDQLAETPGARVTAFAESSSQTLSVPSLESSLIHDVVWVDGDSSLILDAEILSGQGLFEGDHEGCLVSRKTAMQLFGSIDITGQTLQIDGQDYLVRGVYENLSSLSTLGADPGRELAYAGTATAPKEQGVAALHFRIPGISQGDAQEITSQAMGNAGIATSGSFAEDIAGQGLRRFLLTLPALVMLLMAALALLRAALRLAQTMLHSLRAWRADPNPSPAFPRRFAKRCAREWAGLLIPCFLLWFLPVALCSPPASYLPTRWSDFAFWPSLMQRLSQMLAALRLSGGMRPLLLMQTLSLWCVGLCLGAVLLCLSGGRWANRCARAASTATLAFSMLTVGAMGPIGALLCRALGWPLDLTYVQYLLPVALLMTLALSAKTVPAS